MLDPEENWSNLRFVYQHLKSRPRPINNTKIYGADSGSVWAGSTRNAQETFWRNSFGGSASSRFHRPATGLGLGEAAKVHIKSLRLLLGDRSPSEAYCHVRGSFGGRRQSDSVDDALISLSPSH